MILKCNICTPLRLPILATSHVPIAPDTKGEDLWIPIHQPDDPGHHWLPQHPGPSHHSLAAAPAPQGSISKPN